MKYIEKIIIVFETTKQNKYRNEILDTLSLKDKELLILNLRKKNIILNIEEDIIGNKLTKIIKLLDENTDEKLKLAVSTLCFDTDKDILIKQLKDRNRFNKIVTYVNNENYGNISCKKELLLKK